MENIKELFSELIRFENDKFYDEYVGEEIYSDEDILTEEYKKLYDTYIDRLWLKITVLLKDKL